MPAPAAAQTNSFINAGVQFEFPPPGARSLALGGAFVAVADDATASVANPAGLTLLVRPEVSVEGRFWNFSTLAPLRGRYSGTPTGVGYDTIQNIVEDKLDETSNAVSFLSVVIPKNRFAFAGYRQVQSGYRASYSSDGIFIFDDQLVNTTPGQGQDRLDPYTATMSLDVVNYGFSAAYRFAGGLALGGGLAISDFSIEALTNVFYLGLNPNQIPPAQRSQFTGTGLAYGPPDFSEAGRQGSVTEFGDDTGVGVNFGILYRPTKAKWAAGGSVRLGPRFDYDAEARWGPVVDRFPGPPVNGDPLDSDHVEFKVPDTYSFGLSYRPSDRLLFAGQYDRVQYSQLSQNVQDVFANVGQVLTETTQGLSNPDSNQVRFGTEYAVAIAPHVVSLRMGVAYVSDHKMHYTQVGSTRYPRLEVLYQPGEDQWHFTPGAGIAFPKFQIDGAFDFSDLSKTLSLSAVYRF